jgi:hypothetical protein
MNPKADGIDGRVGPDTIDELPLADDLAGPLHQGDENIERAPPEPNRLAVSF